MKLLKPKALMPGANLGIVAPASWAKDTKLRHGLQWLKQLGFKTKLFLSPKQKYGYLSGPDAVRARLLNRAFADKSVDAILCARGGYGSLRILDKIDYNTIRKNPKIFVGFSDITALHLAIYQKTGLSTFHGPMAADFGTAYNRKCLLQIFISKKPFGPMIFPKRRKPKFLRPGKASGPLLGGNLSLVAKLCGTPYFPSFKGAILFLEDIHEAPHRLDGYFAQLRLAGVFDQIAGLILAEFIKTGPVKKNELPLKTIFSDFVGKAPFPVALDFPFGHSADKFTLPLGIRVTLDSKKQNLILEESGVR